MTITRWLHAAAGWLTTTAGFLATNATWVGWLAGCLLLGWGLTPFVTYLSILAIVEASVILVAGRTSEAAIQKKLDVLIAAIPEADDSVIGIEKKGTP